MNELEKAKLVFGDNKNINFVVLSDFDFPIAKYNLVFSSMVIEHVHNPGTYLPNINKMLKDDGFLLIGLPNIIDLNYIINLIFFGQKRALKQSIRILDTYDKSRDHINGWDPLHFIQLCASVGFELVSWLPAGGTPISSILRKIPVVGRYIYHLPFQSRLCYDMFFLLKKKKNICIGPND